MDKGIVKLQQTVIIRKAEHQDVTAVLNVRKQAILAVKMRMIAHNLICGPALAPIK